MRRQAAGALAAPCTALAAAALPPPRRHPHDYTDPTAAAAAALSRTQQIEPLRCGQRTAGSHFLRYLSRARFQVNNCADIYLQARA